MTDTAKQTDAGAQESEHTGETVILRTKPSIRPILIRLVLTLVAGAAVIGAIFASPDLFGSPESANIALVVAQIVVAVAALRLIAKAIVLRATEYVLTERTVRREFKLLARSKSREVPYDLVRSHERSQSRIEYLLGIGSVALNQGLGDLRLEMLPEHEAIYEHVQKRVEAARD